MPSTKKRMRAAPLDRGQPAGRAAVLDGPAVRERERVAVRARIPSGRLARLEIAGWIVVAAAALLLRVVNLDGNPLESSEGALALASWNVLHQTAAPLAPSPLLVYANVLLFLALGASDAVARALPMLAGTFVAMAPLALRRQLGRVGALAAAAILATSPTLLLASRTVDPTMVALALGVGLVLCTLGYARSRRASYLYGAGILLALLLVTGALAYDVLIVLLGFVVVYRWESSRTDRTASPGQSDGATDTVDDGAVADGASSEKASIVAVPSGAPRGAALVAALVLGLVSTGFATNLSGFGDSLATPFGLWAASLTGFAPSASWLFPAILLGYEPLLVVFGIAGGVLAYRRERTFDAFLVWWAVVGFALLVVSDGRHPLWAGHVVIPLALLSGTAIQSAVRALEDREQRLRLAIFAPVALSVVATTLIAAGNASLPDPFIARWVAFLPPLALLLYVAVFGMMFDARTARTSVVAVAAICLFFFDFHAAMRLNPGGPLNPADLFHSTTTSPDVRTLAADASIVLDELHIAKTVQGRTVNETVEILAPYADPLAWYLRQASDVRVVNEVADSPAIAIMNDKDKAPRGTYAGQLYQFSSTAPTPPLDPRLIWRWLIYREPVAGQTDTYVKVYVLAQLGPKQ